MAVCACVIFESRAKPEVYHGATMSIHLVFLVYVEWINHFAICFYNRLVCSMVEAWMKKFAHDGQYHKNLCVCSGIHY